MAEGGPKVFQPGNVLCYEPMLPSGNHAFFVEDTFLIVPTGHETLNPALPYAAVDIEQATTKRRANTKMTCDFLTGTVSRLDLHGRSGLMLRPFLLNLRRAR